ncbi:hypothetical protein K449DRAFT_341472, partial [Hypoxylon sp. EC38]
IGSHICSMIATRAFCTIFSLGEFIPKGLSLPLALGIITLLAGENVNCPLASLRPRSSNHSQVRSSNVPLIDPLVIFPGFPLISS